MAVSIPDNKYQREVSEALRELVMKLRGLNVQIKFGASMYEELNDFGEMDVEIKFSCLMLEDVK